MFHHVSRSQLSGPPTFLQKVFYMALLSRKGNLVDQCGYQPGLCEVAPHLGTQHCPSSWKLGFSGALRYQPKWDISTNGSQNTSKYCYVAELWAWQCSGSRGSSTASSDSPEASCSSDSSILWQLSSWRWNASSSHLISVPSLNICYSLRHLLEPIRNIPSRWAQQLWWW